MQVLTRMLCLQNTKYKMKIHTSNKICMVHRAPSSVFLVKHKLACNPSHTFWPTTLCQAPSPRLKMENFHTSRSHGQVSKLLNGISVALDAVIPASSPQHTCFPDPQATPLSSLCLEIAGKRHLDMRHNFSSYTNVTIKTCQWPVFPWTICSPLTLKIKAIIIFRTQDFLSLQRLRPRRTWTPACLWWLWRRSLLSCGAPCGTFRSLRAWFLFSKHMFALLP